MSINIDIARIAVILLFVITFTLIGWMTPIMYATYMPNDEIIEVHNFDAQDAHVGDEQHYICFDRTVHRPAVGDVFTELYLVSDGDNGTRTEIGSETFNRYFQEGTTTVITPLALPQNLKEGEHRYELVIRMHLSNSRVTRTLSFESETFNVTDDPSISETTEIPEHC